MELQLVESYVDEPIPVYRVGKPTMEFPPLPPKQAHPIQQYCPVRCLQTAPFKVFDAFVTGPIVDIYHYILLLETLRAMDENDIITIRIDSPGGLINSGSFISTHIVECKGTVITRAVGLCASAGSLMWSAGHKCEVGDMAVFMWHMSSHMDMGNSISVRDESIFQVEFVRTNLLGLSLEKGHITKQELEDTCTDPQHHVWVSAKEMRARLQNHVPNELPTESANDSDYDNYRDMEEDDYVDAE